MARMIALKRLRYPRGPSGKEYVEGEPFDTLSERDTKALTLVRAARQVAEDPKQEKQAVEDTDTPRRRRTYRRRDVVAEE